uniref:choice-of-anchor L domain-containing protein n=1 Tax=Flavobacterium sp. TaxID=239 RepID=UPI003750A9C0
MKKILLLLLFILLNQYTFSQGVVVNNTTYTVPQLVQNILFGGSNSSSSCAGTLTNITWSSGTTQGDINNGIGYFTNTNPAFPLASGVVLSTGNALQAGGPNNSSQSNGNWPGDAQLLSYVQSLNIDATLTDYNDATILEFDFVPLSDSMSFDFLFASEEYGTYQCVFSDAFAFFLSNTTTAGPVTNLALIPNTTTPISVVTIRNSANNNSCLSANPTFFGFYNDGTNTVGTASNFNGQTIKMTASSAVIPNNTYHIKLVIADRNDNSFDSAVFLGGGSFNIGALNIASDGYNTTNPNQNLNNFTIANGSAICNQSTRIIKAGPTQLPGSTYVWSLNGTPIPGATNYLYEVTAPGTYSVVVTLASGCSQTYNPIIVEFLPPMPIIIGNPPDITSTTTIFNLNTNNNPIRNGAPVGYEIYYHTLLSDAQIGAFPIPNPATYLGFDGQQIFASIVDNQTGSGCIETRSFFLDVIPPAAIVPNAPINLTKCDDISNNQIESFDFTSQTLLVLGNTYNPTTYTTTYHTSLPNATSGTFAINPITSYNNISNPQTIHVRVQENANPTNFGLTTFQISVDTNINPVFSAIAPICSGTTLSPLPTTSTNGITGTWLPALNNTATTVYTFTPNTGQCSRTTTLTVTVVPQPNAGSDGSTSVCETSTTQVNLSSLITGEQVGGTWTLQSGTGGTFTASNGTFTSAVGATTSVFLYTVSGTSPCLNDTSTVTVTINPQPNAGTDGVLTVCDSSTTQINLFNLIIGEQSGGVWSTAVIGGIFNATAGTYIPAVGATSGVFTYTITGTSPCISDSSSVTLTINPSPNAGADGSTSVCETSTTQIDLFNLITGEQTGGTWSLQSGTGGTFTASNGTFTPAVGATTSVFLYTVS